MPSFRFASGPGGIVPACSRPPAFGVHINFGRGFLFGVGAWSQIVVFNSGFLSI